jgi:hypothetical protein
MALSKRFARITGLLYLIVGVFGGFAIGHVTTKLILVAIATTIMCLNEVFQFTALLVATDGAYVAAFGTSGAQALVLLLIDMHHYGFLIAQIFFGLWLVPLGYLAYRSGMLPKALGVVLIVGGGFYLVDVLAAFLAPDRGRQIDGFLAIPPTIAEIWTLGYLLVRGVNAPRWYNHAT